MIPKKIHYCWFGKKEKNAQIDKCIGSWKRFMPDFQIKQWDESNFPMDSDYVKKAYNKKSWAHVSDLCRLHALFNEGGIYFDTDIEVLKSFEPLLTNNCFLGFQQKEPYWHQQRAINAILNKIPINPFLDRCIGYFVYMFDKVGEFNSSLDWVNNAVIGSIPKHPFLKRCIDEMLKRFDKYRTYYRSPEVTTKVLKEMGLKKYGIQSFCDIKIFTTEYFYPYPWWKELNQDSIRENTYCIHHWLFSWLDDNGNK